MQFLPIDKNNFINLDNIDQIKIYNAKFDNTWRVQFNKADIEEYNIVGEAIFKKEEEARDFVKNMNIYCVPKNRF